MDKKFDLKKDGFNLYWWRIVEHAGTHLDAPRHETGAFARPFERRRRGRARLPSHHERRHRGLPR